MCNHAPHLHPHLHPARATPQYAPMDDAWAELSISVLPSGHVMLTEGGQRMSAPVAARIAKAFTTSVPEGLVQLGTTELQSALPADLAYLRDFARGYLTQLCHASPAETGDLPLPPPGQEELAFIAMRCPPLPGAEYLNAAVLAEWWVALDAHVRSSVGGNPGGVAEFLTMLHGSIGAIHIIDSDGSLYMDDTSTHVPLGQGLIPWDNLGPRLLAVPNVDWWCADLCFYPNAWELIDENLRAAKAMQMGPAAAT